MRLARLLLLPLAAVLATGCESDDGVTVNARPPLAGVRFIHGAADLGPVDIRMIDQLPWSAYALEMPFRGATPHIPSEAKSRVIRVFRHSKDIAVTSVPIVETTVTIEEGRNYTFLLTGTAAANNLRLQMIADDVPALTGQQIAVRFVNALQGVTASGYLTATATTAIPATATWPNVAALSAGQYVTRDTGTFAIRANTATDATLRSATAPPGAPEAPLIGATAGFRAAGTGLSAYLLPASVPGSAAPQPTSTTNQAFADPAIVFYVDRIPTPPGPTN